MKKVNNRNLWNFDLGSQESLNVLLWIVIGFQQRNRQDLENLRNDSFYRLPATRAQCSMGTEKNPNAGILLIYDNNEYSQGSSQIKEVFRTLAKYDSLQPYLSDDDFRTSKAGIVELPYKL